VRRPEFDHVIAAAANVVELDDFVVIGSQAILGSSAAPPDTLLRSMEADLYPRDAPELADAIDGALGDGSARTPVAWCMEPHDLVLAKCVAGRARDWDFARDALAAGIVERRVLIDRAADLPIDPMHREHVVSLLRALLA
jgi:hypothetical protein